MLKKMSPLEIQVWKTIQECKMLDCGDSIVVAASGGADSMALLLCLHHLAQRLQISIAAAHLNHRIRGLEGDADQEFVRQMSSSLSIPFITETIEIKEAASRTKENLEQLARKVRYDFLRRAAASIKANRIAVGHTMNDQAETVLFRFFRGSGIQGLAAIHPILDGMIIRPLLKCTRTEIIEYLRSKGAQYREDSTNQLRDYTRNRIRHELIPSLEKAYNPKLIQTLCRTARLAYETSDFMEAEGAKAFEKIHSKIPNGISLQASEINKLHPALRKQVLRRALRSCSGSLSNVDSQHIQRLLWLCNTAQSGSQIQLPNKVLAFRQFDQIIVAAEEPLIRDVSYSYNLPIPGQCSIPEIGAVFSARLGSLPAERRPNFERQVFLDPSVLPSILTLRPKKPGDRLGGSGCRKVKKLLIDRKIPSAQRAFLPMVVAGSHVIWIPGFRPARAYEAGLESNTCIILDFIKDLE